RGARADGGGPFEHGDLPPALRHAEDRRSARQAYLPEAPNRGDARLPPPRARGADVPPPGLTRHYDSLARARVRQRLAHAPDDVRRKCGDPLDEERFRHDGDI